MSKGIPCVLFMLVSPSPNSRINMLTNVGLLSQYVTKSREQPNEDLSNNTGGEGRILWQIYPIPSRRKLTPGNKNIPSIRTLTRRDCVSLLWSQNLSQATALSSKFPQRWTHCKTEYRTTLIPFLFGTRQFRAGGEKRTVNKFSGWEKLLGPPDHPQATQMSGKCSSVAENVAPSLLLFNSLRSSPHKKCVLFAF